MRDELTRDIDVTPGEQTETRFDVQTSDCHEQYRSCFALLTNIFTTIYKKHKQKLCIPHDIILTRSTDYVLFKRNTTCTYDQQRLFS